ncbi:MAG: Dihydroneopterin aldolase [Actinobacteria bacterium]|nr:Dihydroneopterin aldolase [Actinomycetota bacterium]
MGLKATVVLSSFVVMAAHLDNQFEEGFQEEILQVHKMRKGRAIILIKDLRLFGHHGVYEREKREGQPFIIDLEIEADIADATHRGQLKDTVDYGQVVNQVARIVEEESFDLIEALAEKIAAELLKEEKIKKVAVTVKKPEAPLSRSLEYVGVRLVRGKDSDHSDS